MNIRNGQSRLAGRIGLVVILEGSVVSIEISQNEPQPQVDI